MAAETRDAASHIGALRKNTEELVHQGTLLGKQSAQVFDRIIDESGNNARRIAAIASEKPTTHDESKG